MTNILLGLSLLVSIASQSPASQIGTKGRSDPPNHDIYVSVLDGSGKPVAGLSTGDFSVTEDGNPREVLKAGPATAPLTISILVDDSQAAQPAVQHIREGLSAFVKALEGKAEIAIATIGERPTIAVDYTKNNAALERGINRIFSRRGAGAYLMDGIVEVSRGLQKREAARPVIVALTIEEGPEFSNRYYEPVLEELQKSGAALHVLAIGSPSSSQADEMRNRNIVIAEGTSRTGGRRDQVLAVTAIPELLNQLAAELTTQYVVTYARPETLIPPEKVEVAVNRPGLTVRGPKRVSGQ